MKHVVIYSDIHTLRAAERIKPSPGEGRFARSGRKSPPLRPCAFCCEYRAAWQRSRRAGRGNPHAPPGGYTSIKWNGAGASGVCLAVLCCHGMHVSDRANRSGFSLEHQPSAGAAFRYGLTDSRLHILAPRPTVIHHHPGPLRALRILLTLRAGHFLIQPHLQPSLTG
jgi:hypothetical protein